MYHSRGYLDVRSISKRVELSVIIGAVSRSYSVSIPVLPGSSDSKANRGQLVSP